MTVLVALLALAYGTWAVVLQRRLGRAADVEHELRGALTAVGLAAARRRDPALTAAYEGQLMRVRSATGAGGGSCALAPLLEGVTVAAPGAVAIGNLVANVLEHGTGPVTLRIELLNARSRSAVDRRPRGRGLRIAARAARAAGGRLEVREEAGLFTAAVEIPVER